MRSPIVELLEPLAARFEQLKIRWYLFGAQASILHGAARLTAGVDITVQQGARSTTEIVAALRQAGLQLRVDDAEFVELTRVLPAQHASSGLAVDVVLSGPGLEELFFERVETRDLGGLTVPVACAADIVAMKILAGRPKDMEDVVAILAAQGEDFDLALAEQTLDLLERALGQSDLLPELDRAARLAGLSNP